MKRSDVCNKGEVNFKRNADAIRCTAKAVALLLVIALVGMVLMLRGLYE